MSYTAPTTSEYKHSAFLQVLIIDLALYGLLFWRDYSDPAQMLVAHYISFVALTDLAVFFLPLHQRRWFNWFRLTSALAFLVLICSLYAKGLDGESLALTLCRGVLVLVRMAHAGLQLRKFGPGYKSLADFPARAARFFNDGNRSERWGCGYLLVGLALLYFPQLGYWTHYNGGEQGLDDILTGLQAQAGLNFAIKLFVFEVLICRADARFWMRGLVAALFIIQWPLMPGMFFLAPLPMVHAAVEIYELTLALLAYRHWRDLRAGGKADGT